jgi:histidinol-phosphate aminotransferase
MKKPDFRQLANKGIRTLTPYQPGKPIEELERELGIKSSIKLASNENPLGPSPKAIQAAQQALANVHIYPDGGCYELKQALANYLSVDTSQLTIGNGSENVLELIGKAYLQNTDNAVISQYAFLTIPLIIQSFGAEIKTAAADNWGHSVDNMLQAIDDKTRVLFVVNPNNPTGTYTNKQDFTKLMNSVPKHVIVVLDEAYAEFIEEPDYPDALSYLAHHPNLIITRTFSKVYGLAGMRIGFAISSPEIADILNRARLPFNVNTLAAKAAQAALLDKEHLRKTIDLNKHGKQLLIKGLEDLKLSFIPSLANFITVDVGDGPAVYQKLLHHGVIVRPLKAYDMPRHIRVSIGTEEQIQRFLTSLATVLPELRELA